MARHYAPKAVLRHLPLTLIRTFLNQTNIPVGAEWDAIVEGDTNSLYQAWCNLAPEHRGQVEMMMRQVHEMASESGVRGMVAEACHRGYDIADSVAEIEGAHAKALWGLIHHPHAFLTARQILATVSPVGRFWNLTTGFANQPFHNTPQSLQDLRSALKQLYREQGRGHKCSIEPYERNGIFYLFIYLDDYTQTHTTHDTRGTLIRTPIRPAFEVVYVYIQSDGNLDMYARGDRRWRTALRDLFCEHILRTPAPHTELSRRVYRLNNLIHRAFPLTIDPTRGIMNASIRKLRVLSTGNLARRVLLEADPHRADDIYEMLDIHFPVEQFPRQRLLVNLATFTVRYVPPGEERERTLTFDVSYPDACNLKSLPDDQREVGEWCLRQWGILSDETGNEPDDGLLGVERAA